MNITNLMKFGREVKEEAGRITWPGFAETRAMSVMVFILVALVAVYLLTVDGLIGLGLKALLGVSL